MKFWAPLFALLLGLCGPFQRSASAHGGLPVSTELLFRGERIYVPTQYWGVFVRAEDRRWCWICDEAINNYKLRDVRLGLDGTFYATDITGITVSRDGGCTWEVLAGPMSMDDVSALSPDPKAPSRLWVTSIQNGQSVLFRSNDAGRAWDKLYTAKGQGLRGLAVSQEAPEGGKQSLYLTTLDNSGEKLTPVLHASRDSGMTFSQVPITVTLTPTQPIRIFPLGVDPRAPKIVYLVAVGEMDQYLIKADVEALSFTQVLHLQRPIFAVTVDLMRNRLLVATGDGIYSADGDAALVRNEGLSRAQCVTVHDGEVYACSWNYHPDMAAVASSPDGKSGFRKVFQYADASGILKCPANSPVAKICPDVWATYSSQLGIDPRVSKDGPPLPPPEEEMPGCGCHLGQSGAGKVTSSQGLFLLALGLFWVGRSRRGRGAAKGADVRSASGPAGVQSR